MSVELPDVDLDVKNRDKAVSLFREAVPASQIATHVLYKDSDDDAFELSGGSLVKHATGLYFQNIPTDPTNGLSAFPFSIAEDLGYYKVDMIPNHVYDLIGSEDELITLLDAPVDWEWFQDSRFFINDDHKYRLTHLGKPRYLRLCQKYKPKSVLDIAALIAVIRPQKAHLLKECQTIDEIKEHVWKRESDVEGYFFKKSHSVAFAMLVVLHAKIIARRLTPRFYEEDDGFFF